MKLSLAEARLILDNKEKELRDKVAKRNSSLRNVYKKVNGGEKELTHEPHEFTVDDLTADVTRLEKEIRKLRLLLAEYNIKTLVDFTVDGEKISLQEAIYLIKQYRDGHPSISSMGEQKVSSRFVDLTPRSVAANAVDRSYDEITEPTFDTKKYREKAQKVEVLIRKLEVAINQGNYGTVVDVDFLPELQ